MHKSFQEPATHESPKSPKIVTKDIIQAKRPVTTQKKGKDPIFSQSAGVKRNNEALTSMQNSRKSIQPYEKGANDHFRSKPNAKPFLPSTNGKGIEDTKSITSKATQKTEKKTTKSGQQSLMARLS